MTDPYAHLGTPVDQTTPTPDAAPKNDAPAPDAPTSDTPATAPADPYANVGADPNTPAKVEPVGYETVGGFNDELPRHSEMPPEIQKQIVNILSTHPVETAASDARTFAASHGYNPAPAQDKKFADSFDEVTAYRKTHGVISDSVINHLPDPKQSGQSMDAGAAGVRGAGDAVTAGLVTHLDSALHAVKDVATGQDKDGFFNDFNRWEDVNQGILQADEANHPYARLTGQLLGGLAIPTGLEGVGLEAGKSVLVAGGTMREARAAAAAAVRNRIAMEGSAYGAVHGAATADPGHRVAGAVTGGITGGAGGYALAKAGQVAAPYAKAAAKAVSDMLPEASEAIPNATDRPDYVQIARDLNIRRTPATNSRTGAATAIQTMLDTLPGGGPIAAGAERETSDLGNAAKTVAEGVGPVSSPQGAGEAVAEGAKAYQQSSRLAGNSLYKARDDLMGGQGSEVPTPGASAAITDMATKFPTSPAIQQLYEHPAIRAIAGALPGENKQPLTLGEATEALSFIRGVKRKLGADVTPSPIMGRVSQLEQALEDDVMAAAKQSDLASGRVPGQEGSAVKAQQDADAFWADRAAALNGSLKKAVKSANDDTQVSGEAVYHQVSGDMDAKSGNLSRLRDTWFRLPAGARQTFAATKIDDLGRANPGNQNDLGNVWSFNTFLTNWSKISPQSRNIVFGAKADADLQKIAAYASRLRQLDKARNFSNTAKKYFAGAFLAAVLPTIYHGDLAGMAEAAAAVPTTWGGAKLLLATPKMRDWTAQAMKAVASPNSETTLRVLTKQLEAIAATEPAIATEVLGLQKAITKAANDNLRSAAASGSQQNPQPERKKPNGSRQ